MKARKPTWSCARKLLLKPSFAADCCQVEPRDLTVCGDLQARRKGWLLTL